MSLSLPELALLVIVWLFVMEWKESYSLDYYLFGNYFFDELTTSTELWIYFLLILWLIEIYLLVSKSSSDESEELPFFFLILLFFSYD